MDAPELVAARQTIADLRYQIECLERERLEARAADLADAYRLAFRLTPSQAVILAALRSRAGRVVSRWALFSALYAGREEPEDGKIMDVFMCAVRKRLPPGSIAASWGEGWALTATGIAAVDAAIARHEAALAPLVAA